MNLVAIPFIYIGFSVSSQSLVLTVPAALFFLLLAYLGYKKSYIYTIVGLALHGVWDILFPYVSTVAPHGYDVFCITIDVLAAAYFYFKIRKLKVAKSDVTGEDDGMIHQRWNWCNGVTVPGKVYTRCKTDGAGL